MIANDQQLQVAQAAVENLQRVLLAARKVHSPHDYRLMSAPILLELQQREQEILAYLSRQSRKQCEARHQRRGSTEPGTGADCLQRPLGAP